MYITICETDRPGSPAWHSVMTEGGMGVRREAEEGGDTYIHIIMAD